MENQGKDDSIEKSQPIVRKKKRFKLIKFVWKVIEKIIMIALIIISAIIVIQRVSNNEKTFFGYRIFRVETGSMIPKYQIGDVILVKEKDINQIVKGDDVTYWGTTGAMKGKLVTHQVIDIEMYEGKKIFHTKGIANNLEDPVIYGEQINGVVQGKLYILTLICSLLNNKYIFYYCIILPILIVIFFKFIKSNLQKFEEYK